MNSGYQSHSVIISENNLITHLNKTFKIYKNKSKDNPIRLNNLSIKNPEYFNSNLPSTLNSTIENEKSKFKINSLSNSKIKDTIVDNCNKNICKLIGTKFNLLSVKNIQLNKNKPVESIDEFSQTNKSKKYIITDSSNKKCSLRNSLFELPQLNQKNSSQRKNKLNSFYSFKGIEKLNLNKSNNKIKDYVSKIKATKQSRISNDYHLLDQNESIKESVLKLYNKIKLTKISYDKNSAQKEPDVINDITHMKSHYFEVNSRINFPLIIQDKNMISSIYNENKIRNKKRKDAHFIIEGL